MRLRRPPPPPPDQVRVVGAEPEPVWRDLYHTFLTISWWGALGILALAWFAVNLVFALAYAVVGGVEGVQRGDLAGAFHFSVQTFGTIGYGVMHPVAGLAHLLVDAESLAAVVLTALATGLLFAKFARIPARVTFSDRAAIGPWDGVPTVSIRVGNQRGNRIIDVRFRAVIFRTEKLAEGQTFYRMYDLVLERDWAPALARSLHVLHRIVPGSPFYGLTPDQVSAQEIEIVLMVTGVDETTLAPVHALTRYEAYAWGARHADVLTEAADGALVLDMRRFHDLVPTAPIDGFPYRWSAADELDRGDG